MTTKANETNRILWADLARTLAIVLVVLTHSLEAAIPMNLTNFASIDAMHGIVTLFIFSITRVGVPIFLMLTGYFLLDRPWDTESCIKFWKTKWLYLFIVSEIWIALYNLYLALYEKADITWRTWIMNALFLKHMPLPHVWYLPMILGVYILIPFAGIALQKINPRILIFPMIIYGVYSFVLPVISVVLRAKGCNALSYTFNLGYSGGGFGMYPVIGWLIKKYADKKIHLIRVIPVIWGAFICAFGLQLWCYSEYYSYNIWYDNIFLLVYSSAIFLCLSKIGNISSPASKIFRDISRKSFGIFLLHVPIIRFSLHFITGLTASSYLQIFILWDISFIVSWLIVTLIALIPKVGKKLFYM
ncbi:MAG: acyltransferase [Lachnospiraceae bacterium]|nr:acyltransferase [Lachnospiraceae bacterium]